jgi:hypothetical protein
MEVEPAASQLLDVLVELGHLDDHMLNLVNDRLLDLSPLGGIITLQDVRRVVAEVLFEQEGTFDPEFMRLINQEWGLLFF